MKFEDSEGCVIVPARLEDAVAVARLDRVVAGLSHHRQRVVIVAQPAAPASEALAALRAWSGTGVEGITIEQPLGKWPAVGRALPLLSGREHWVAVFDGDGAFSAADLPALVEPVTAGRAVHAIGRRPARSLSLEAAGQTSRHSRIYVEAFFNTLALLHLGVGEHDVLCGFDIQCGLHVFGRERYPTLVGTGLPFYGGELHVFVDTMQRGGGVVGVDVAVEHNPPSTYRMSEIVGALLELPFIAAAEPHHFERALAMAPRWYRHWGLDPERFDDEMRATVLEHAATRRPTP